MNNPAPAYDFIGEYASILNQIESMITQGQQPPADMVQRALQFETTAQARLNPEQLDNTMDMVNHIRAEGKARDGMQKAFRGHVGEQVRLSQLLRKNTDNFGPDGSPVESMDEFSAVLKGEKFTRKNQKKSKAQHRMASGQAFAKSLGFKSVSDGIDFMDGVAHHYYNNEEEATRRLKSKGLTEEDFHAFQSSRTALILQNGLNEQMAKNEPAEIEHTPDAHSQYHATVLKAAADSGADELIEGRDVPEDWRDPDRGDGITSDIINAMEHHENIATAEELMETENEILANTGSN